MLHTYWNMSFLIRLRHFMVPWTQKNNKAKNACRFHWLKIPIWQIFCMQPAGPDAVGAPSYFYSLWINFKMLHQCNEAWKNLKPLCICYHKPILCTHFWWYCPFKWTSNISLILQKKETNQLEFALNWQIFISYYQKDIESLDIIDWDIVVLPLTL